MERKKTKIELPDIEEEVLKMCLFIESFDSIVEESELTDDPAIIGDAIKNLIHFKLLTAVNAGADYTWMYDGDKMRESSFKATALGLEWME